MAKAATGTRSKKSLVVVESPAKARTIEQYLGKEFVVRASMGHVRDLPKKDLGVDLEGGAFRPKYVALRTRSKVVAELRKLADKADAVYLATDPDREGEAIAWHVAAILGEDDPAANPRFRRLTFNEITRGAVQASLENVTRIDPRKVDAQQARRVLDRLVGYQVSPLLWRALYRGLSAGRVQSVALRQICEREAEIEAFTPREYWTLEALFDTSGPEGPLRYPATLDRVEGQPAKIDDGARAAELAEAVREPAYRIASIEAKKRQRTPPPPFITSTLQQEAARKLGFSAKRTMMVAQQLYEGIEVPGHGALGMITYMRTDSVRLSEQAVADARDVIRQSYGPDYLPPRPRHYRGRKGAQDAHEAVRPTDLARPPAEAKGYLARDQFRLYELIWNRFLACQMKPAEFESTTVLTEGGPFRFRSTGSVLIFPGYLALYREGSDAGDADEGRSDQAGDRPEAAEQGNREREEEDGSLLPAGLREGADAHLAELEQEQHFTKPPPRFTEASLVRQLEQDGIGRPSTYAQIISVLLDRTYMERDRKSLLPTPLGRQVNDLLVSLFPDIFQVAFTARMEEELDKIETGQDRYEQVLASFWEPFSADLEKAGAQVKSIKRDLQQKTEEQCPQCQKPLVIKWGRRGRFVACSGFPECTFTRPLEEEAAAAPPVEARCPECEAAMVVKNGRFGRFLACSRYPECKGTRPFSVGVNCPECGQPLAEKRSRKGRTFFGCTGYPTCTFATWDPPVALPCPTCAYPMMVEKNTRAEGRHHYCPKCKGVTAPPE